MDYLLKIFPDAHEVLQPLQRTTSSNRLASPCENAVDVLFSKAGGASGNEPHEREDSKQRYS
jgi:hypothetical protein